MIMVNMDASRWNSHQTSPLFGMFFFQKGLLFIKSSFPLFILWLFPASSSKPPPFQMNIRILSKAVFRSQQVNFFRAYRVGPSVPIHLVSRGRFNYLISRAAARKNTQLLFIVLFSWCFMERQNGASTRVPKFPAQIRSNIYEIFPQHRRPSLFFDFE